MMDVATLTLKSLGDTLSPDDYTRTNAELQLKQLTEAQGTYSTTSLNGLLML